MICSHCQTVNLENAAKCVKCGLPLGAAAVPPSVEDEFELQPEAPKSERASVQGPPRIDIEKLGEESEKPVQGKKPKKKIPPLPKDYKREAQMQIAIMGGLFFVPIVLNCMGFGGFVGWGVPNMVGIVFGGLALLESIKVVQYHNAGDYDGSAEASTAAQRFIKWGYLAALATLALLVIGYILWLIFAKVMTIMAPKTSL